MTVAQVRQLLDLSGCDASSDETETEVSLCRGDGHSGSGLYFWVTDYADEGALLLDGEVQCDLPPFGWRCTRQAGHEGPCAAVEAPEDQALVERGMERLKAAPQSPVAPAVSATVPDDMRTVLAFLFERFGDTSDAGELPDEVIAAVRRLEVAPTPPTSAADAVDAARYRWLRGPDQESTRYSRWRIEYWDGPNGWEPVQRECMDAAVDAAIAASKETT